MGRMISQIATAIRGKNSPHFRNSQADVKNGDVCVIVNAADPLLTGKKLLFKDLKYHTGFVGHLRTHSYKHVLNKKPELLVWKFFYQVLLSPAKVDAQEQGQRKVHVKPENFPRPNPRHPPLTPIRP